MTNEKQLLNIYELCDRYGFKVWTIRSYCSQGKIPFIKIGRRVYFKIEATENWLAEHAQPVEEVVTR